MVVDDSAGVVVVVVIFCLLSSFWLFDSAPGPTMKRVGDPVFLLAPPS
jgi:hypothetical protein